MRTNKTRFLPRPLQCLLFACFAVFYQTNGFSQEDPKQTASEALDTSASPVTAPVTRGSLNPAKRGLAPKANAKVMIIPVNDEETSKDGMIDEWQANFIERRLQRAQSEHFDLVILEIDTYGGSVQACERINNAIAKCSVPVVAFVKQKAFSGGALLSLGCKAIVMVPGSRIGGAKAVSMYGDVPADMRPKIDSNMRAMVVNLCEANKYPVPIAIGMVNTETEVIETNDPKNRFMLGETFDELKVKPDVVHKWKTKGAILTLTANEAVNTGFASGLAGDEDEVLLGLSIQPAEIIRADITASEKIARFLSHPAWRVLLVIAGLIGLFVEMKAPGHGAGYIIFALCLGAVFWLHFFADNAGLWEVALFGAGSVLIALEVFVFPTFGGMLFAGFGMVLLSIIFAFLPASISLSNVFSGKASAGEMLLLTQGLKWAVIATISIVVVAITALVKGIQMPGLNRLALQAASGGMLQPSRGALIASMSAAVPHAALAVHVGKAGVAETVLRPSGKVRMDGVTYDAVSESAFIEAGSEVVVLRIYGGNLVVRSKGEA